MAVATKAAAFGAFLRLFDVALLDASADWAPALAVLATITIVVGNVGALGQSSLKRLMAWSSVAQAGYMLAGVVVATRLGVQATVFYLGVYLMMNLAAFAVIVIRERETGPGRRHRLRPGPRRRSARCWPMAMTLAMLGLAGIPATAGFIGKFYLIDAAIDGDYAWLGVVIVIGSMISLAYYLKVIAAMWMAEAPVAGTALQTAGQPAMAGGSAEADTPRIEVETWFVALLFGAATLFFGIVPSPLFNLAVHAGALADPPVLGSEPSRFTRRRYGPGVMTPDS